MQQPDKYFEYEWNKHGLLRNKTPVSEVPPHWWNSSMNMIKGTGSRLSACSLIKLLFFQFIFNFVG